MTSTYDDFSRAEAERDASKLSPAGETASESVHLWDRPTHGAECGDKNAMNIVGMARLADVTCPECLKRAVPEPVPTEGSELTWTQETMRIINELTPDIKGKPFDPDWFLLRQRFEEIERLASAPEAAAAGESFQRRVELWCLACFGPEITMDRVERNHRFLEESLELVQAIGCTRSEALQLVDYVFSRPKGEPSQELGGVVVTLNALATAFPMPVDYCGEKELKRVWGKLDKIRAKQAAKPTHSPLPESAAPIAPAAEELIQELVDALWEAAQSLRTIADGAGRREFMEHMDQVRGYANSRANVAHELAEEYRKGAKNG